jgi:hypothetical protein
MANTIITKNSSTASAVPTAGQLVQGELAVNVTDKRLFTENSGGTVVELGTNPSQVNFADNAKAIFGAGSDLQIYHSGSHSWVQDAGTGNLYIAGAQLYLTNSDNTKQFLKGDSTGRVDLYYNTSVKLATTATGIDVTGTVVADELQTLGNVKIVDSLSTARNILLLASDDVVVQTGTSTGARSVILKTEGLSRLKVDALGDVSFYEDTGTTAKFFWDASAESLGIGTSSPNAKIEIENGAEGLYFTAGGDNAANGRALRFTSSTSSGGSNGALHTIKANSTAGEIAFANGNGNIMYLNESGNVGIGTSSPAEKLEVAGNIKLNTTSPNLYFTVSTGTKYNWMVAAQENIDNCFEITPSTTAGGSTFSTPAVVINSSGTLGLGVTPSAWATLKPIQFAGGASLAGFSNTGYLNANAYFDGSWRYIATATSGRYEVAADHKWFSAASGTAGNAISFTQAMTLDASGQLGIGATLPSATLDIVVPTGTAKIKVGNNTLAGGSYLNLQGASGSKTWFVASNYNIGGALEFIQSTANGGSTPAGTASMLLDSSGDVGIGTTSGHGSKVAIRTTGANQTALRLDSGANNPENYIALDFGLQGIALSTGYGAFIRGYNYGNNDYRGFLTFGTSAAGGGGTVERARIDHSGQVLIGNTTAVLGTGFANRVGRLHVGTSGGSGGFGAMGKVASGNSATFVVINNASYRVTVYSTNNSTSARIGQYIFVGLNSVVQNPTVLTVATTGSPNWTFSFSVANTNDTLVTVAASSDNQGTRIIVEQLGDA